MLRGSAAASAVFVVASSVLLAGQQPSVRSFNADAPGAPPPGFTFAATRQPQPGTWVIRAAADGQYLVHDADEPAQAGVSLAMTTSPPVRDVLVAARLKLTDRGAGGLVWRYQDPQNYYAVSLDFARHEIAMYRVVQGNRVRVDHEDDLELDEHAWHSLKVVHQDNSARVYLSGIRVFEVRDRTFRTGTAGVWASSGTRAAFDDLRIELLKDHDR